MESDKKAAILSYLQKKGTAKSSQIAENIGLGVSRTKDYLSELVREGVVISHGTFRNRTYSLKEQYD